MTKETLEKVVRQQVEAGRIKLETPKEVTERLKRKREEIDKKLDRR